MQPKHAAVKPKKTCTEISPCPYFKDGRPSATEFLLHRGEWINRYHTFLARGYRRIGSVIYRNVCKKCSSCMPLRIETSAFQASKSQKKTLKKNSDIRLEIRSPFIITPDKVELFEKYQNSKHKAEDREAIDYQIFLSISHFGYTHTIEMDYYLGSRLIAVGIVDVTSDSLSSNYFYYDTDYLHRRPGVYSILQEIMLAGIMGKKYYYLGFYIEDVPKMSYKKFFRPNQILEKGKWKGFKPTDL
jgi:arginine-tRNA-protein transferase